MKTDGNHGHVKAVLAQSERNNRGSVAGREAYDDEVLRGLRSGKDTLEAIKQANEKYPGETLNVDENNLGDVASHYEFLLEYENIRLKMVKDTLQRKSGSRK